MIPEEIRKKIQETISKMESDPRERHGIEYIENMVQLVRGIMFLKTEDLEFVDLSEIRDTSGHQVRLRFKQLYWVVNIDVLFIIELPDWLRGNILNGYEEMLGNLSPSKRRNHPSLEHQRIFSELKQIQATKSYPGVLESDIHTLINYCIKEMRVQVRIFSKKTLKSSKLSDVECDAKKLSFMSNILKHSARAHFRILYLSYEINETKNPSVMRQFSNGYFKGCVDSINHYIKVVRTGIDAEVTRFEEEMQKILGAKLIKTKNMHFPGDFFIAAEDEDGLARLREIKMHWDQLKYKKISEIRREYDVKRLKSKFDSLMENYKNGECSAQEFLKFGWREFRSILIRIRNSLDPQSWVHASLDLDRSLEKIDDLEHQEQITWVWDNAAALAALNSKIIDELGKLVEGGLVKVNSDFQKIYDIFKNYKLSTNQKNHTFDKSSPEEYYRLFTMFEDLEEGECQIFDLLKCYMEISGKYNQLELEDTAYYGKLIGAFPNHQEREMHLLSLFAEIRKFKDLEIRSRNLVIRKYFDNVSIDRLTNELLCALQEALETSIVKNILQNNYKLMTASKLKAKFEFTKKEPRPDKERQLKLINYILNCIPPANKIEAYQKSAYTNNHVPSFDLASNEGELENLKRDILPFLGKVGEDDDEVIFTIIKLKKYWHKVVADDLRLLKSRFVNILCLRQDEPLVYSYRVLKENIREGQRWMSGIYCTNLFESYQIELKKILISKEEFKQILNTNIQKLQNLLVEANDALRNLRKYHRELGSTEDFSYLDMVLSPDRVQQAMQKYNFLITTPYEELQRFGVIYTNRNRLLEEIIRRSIESPQELSESLKTILTQSAAERYLKHKTINANLKLRLLTEMATHMDVEMRYLCMLANYVEQSKFREADGVARIIKVFDLVDDGLPYLLALRSLFGSMKRHFFKTFKPVTHESNFEGNRTALFSDLKEVEEKLILYNS